MGVMSNTKKLPLPKKDSMAEGFEGDQHLQRITLNRVPIPDKTIGCQDLLKQDVSCKGWLKRKKPWKILSKINISVFLQPLTWEQKYVIISKGCIYFYKAENDKKPEKAISLFGYTRVMRAGAGKLSSEKNAVWPFQVAYVLDDKDKVHYFSAACEDDMMKWLRCIKHELYRANGVEYPDECGIDEDIHDLETPISTKNYFEKIQNLNKIKKAVNSDDSDLDDEYDYIEPPDAAPQGNKTSSDSARSQNKATAARPLPLKPAESKATRQKPNLESPDSKHSPSSASVLQNQGYYPPILNSDSSVTSKKPVAIQCPPIKKLPPATPSKPRAQVTPNIGTVHTGLSSPEVTTGSSVSVAALKTTLFGGPLESKLKPFKPPKPSCEVQPPSPSPSPSPSNVVKPLPPVPGRIGNIPPTAVVSPVRQPKQTAFENDLEASALWPRDAGEGQRFLVSLGQEGAYMLRKSTDGPNAHTLLVIAECQLRKYRIFQNAEGMYSLLTDYDPSFDSIHNLLNHYRTSFLPLRRTPLSCPYSELCSN